MIKKENAIKTKKAPVLATGKSNITAYYFGDKDPWNKAIWFDDQGNAYELMYARLSKKYFFNPYTYYNKAN